ncbi:MAG: 50S ribosomal protein L29 [Chloroflexaceae bacterium]|nr:50S ribosomal protein L29 [Chloroflexaceae bacterium]
MKAQELRSLKDDALRERLMECYQELFNLRFQKVSGRLANTARPRQVRRDIARIKTIQRERELINEALEQQA